MSLVGQNLVLAERICVRNDVVSWRITIRQTLDQFHHLRRVTSYKRKCRQAAEIQSLLYLVKSNEFHSTIVIERKISVIA